MAAKKKKRSTGKRKSVKQVPQHTLPAGFWNQVGAVLLFLLSALFIIAWFGVGGPILDWMQTAALATVGWAVYVLPLVFVYLAVEIFRADNNRVPVVMQLASLALVVWFSGLFGLIGQTPTSGGFFGDTINDGMLALVESGVATIIYVLLIILTSLFIIKVSPFTLLNNLWELVRTRSEANEQAENVKVMKKAAALEVKGESAPSPGFQLNAGVPVADPNEKPLKKLSSFKGSVPQDKSAEGKTALVSVSDPNWKAPSLDLLEKKQSPADAGDVQHNAQIIKETLSEFSIDVEMEGANIGPKVTQYTLKPPSGVKLARIAALETNIALNLAAQSLRIEVPIPGMRAVGIEVPNKRAADVRIRGILESKQWRESREPLAFAIGKDISGSAVVGQLNKMPHLLVAGQTGSGKSVMINTLLTSLLYHNSPSEMKLILVDPKQVEMAPYEDIPHLLTPIITEPEKTISALKWAVNEMERRYKLMAEAKIKDIKTYNQSLASGRRKIPVADETGETEQADGAMPYIVIVIDELADLMMMAARDVEPYIVRLAQKARAVGIHMVLATQRPSVNVITGLIKANVPARIAFTVASGVDSKTILDGIGAEKLLGQGDMLLKTAEFPKPKRVQGAWVMDEEVLKITDHLRMQGPPQYNEEIISQPVQINGKGGIVMDMGEGGSGGDDMYRDALQVVVQSRKASTSLLQRKLRIGYARAARIIEEMEEQGVIGPPDGSRPRDVLISSMDELNGSSED